jgi:glycosyltransferase involved in cell wall biosynthesis
MAPKVSIIIPTYNRLKTLLNTIESIQKQIYQNYEVIIVDDCSDDGTPQALDKFNRVRVLINDTRKGPSYSRNRGIIESTGEYVWFLDSDVVLPDENLLDRLVVAYTSQPDVGSLGGEIVVYDQNSERAYGRKILWNACNVAVTSCKRNNALVRCDYLATCNCFTKKEYAQRLNGFDEQFVFGAEDMDFGIRIKELGCHNYVRHDLAVFHYHDKKGRYIDETERYQKTRIIYARKHYRCIRIIGMFAFDFLLFIIFYLLLLPKLLYLLISSRDIKAQNLTGGLKVLSFYFSA